MTWKRRQFLRTAALSSLGIGFATVARAGDRLLAQLSTVPKARRLALLVGINDYPASSHFPPLSGCLTDVEMQRHLLIHRFGFHPRDIVVLADAQATRAAILEAFEQHLLGQAKAGDGVVFHFSGHGSRVQDPLKEFADGLNSTLVPVDAGLPKDFAAQGAAQDITVPDMTVQDIMGHTLDLLTRAMPTQHFTTVLDCCHAGGGLRGLLRVRAREGGMQLRASAAELAFQERWRQKLQLSPQQWLQLRRSGLAKGVAIAAAKRDQLATDAPFGDFFAGAFSYTLTQYLWQQTQPLTTTVALAAVAEATAEFSTSGQEPEFQQHPEGKAYFSPDGLGAEGMNRADLRQPAMARVDAVITAVRGDSATLWLGGLLPESLEAFDDGGEFTPLRGIEKRPGNGSLRVVVQSRQGLVGQAKIVSSGAIAPQSAESLVGTPLQESVRSIPTDLALVIGLDPASEFDKPTALQQLNRLDRITGVDLKVGSVNSSVHYLFGRFTQPQAAARSAAPQSSDPQSPGPSPALGSFGLFTPSGERVPASFGAAGESVTAALERLQPKLSALLAGRLVKLLINATASPMAIAAVLMDKPPLNKPPVDKPPTSTPVFVPAQTFELRTISPPPIQAKVPIGTELQLQIQNQEAYPLYVTVLAIDATGVMTLLVPGPSQTEPMRIEGGQTRQFPTAGFSLVAQAPKGGSEVLILASPTAFGESLQALQSLTQQRRSAPSQQRLKINSSAIAGLLISFEVV